MNEVGSRVPDKPLVSVITPSYDRPSRVKDAVRSVKDQSYEKIEHVIVDDHSDTPVSSVLEERENLHIERHKRNKGACAARNTGIEAASGDLVAFLDDDDEWRAEKVERQVECALSSNAGVIYCGVEQVSDGRIFASQIPTVNGDITRELLTDIPIKSTSTVMVWSELFESVGGFDSDLRNHQDWEFYIRASRSAEFDGVREVLVTRYHHGDQISSNYEDKRDISVPRMKEKHTALAEEYGVKREFYAILEQTLGATAIEAGDYRAARDHYLRALKLSPSKKAALRSAALIAGGISYRPARFSRRAIYSIRDTVSS